MEFRFTNGVYCISEYRWPTLSEFIWNSYVFFLLLDGRTDRIGLPRKIDYGKPVYQRIRKSEVQNTPDLQKAKKAVAVQQNTRTVFLYHSGRVDYGNSWHTDGDILRSLVDFLVSDTSKPFYQKNWWVKRCISVELPTRCLSVQEVIRIDKWHLM